MPTLSRLLEGRHPTPAARTPGERRHSFCPGAVALTLDWTIGAEPCLTGLYPGLTFAVSDPGEVVLPRNEVPTLAELDGGRPDIEPSCGVSIPLYSNHDSFRRGFRGSTIRTSSKGEYRRVLPPARDVDRQKSRPTFAFVHSDSSPCIPTGHLQRRFGGPTSSSEYDRFDMSVDASVSELDLLVVEDSPRA